MSVPESKDDSAMSHPYSTLLVQFLAGALSGPMWLSLMYGAFWSLDRARNRGWFRGALDRDAIWLPLCLCMMILCGLLAIGLVVEVAGVLGVDVQGDSSGCSMMAARRGCGLPFATYVGIFAGFPLAGCIHLPISRRLAKWKKDRRNQWHRKHRRSRKWRK
jgi:hypothetical protein